MPPTSKAKLTTVKKAKLLRDYGFAVTYGTKGKRGKLKVSPQAAGQVTRQWKKVKHYVENTKQDFSFQKAKGDDLEAIARGLSPKQVTPGGFFIRKAKGAKKVPKYTVRKDGTIEYKAFGPKGGKVTEEIHPIDPELLAEDPPRAINKLITKAAAKKAKIVLTVNGFDSRSTREYNLDALAFYIAQDLLPKFLDPNLDPAYTKVHRTKNGVPMGPGTIEEFVEIFHIKITKHDSHKTGKGKRGSRR